MVRRRQADGDGSPYALTLAFDGQIYHMLIRRRDSGKFSLGTERPDQHVRRISVCLRVPRTSFSAFLDITAFYKFYFYYYYYCCNNTTTNSFNGPSSRSTGWAGTRSVENRHYPLSPLSSWLLFTSMSVSSIFYGVVHQSTPNCKYLNHCQQLLFKSF